MTVRRRLFTLSDSNRLSPISQEGKRRSESGALLDAVTVRRNRPTVKLNEMPNDRKTQTQSTKTSRRGTVCLTKSIENARQELRVDSLPCIAYAHAGIRSVAVHSHMDFAAV